MAATEPRPPRGTWGACRYCGVAVPTGADQCPLCGAGRPLGAAEIPVAPPAVRRRIRLTGYLRSIIVLVVVVGLTYAMVSAVLQGPPVLTGDPLDTAGTWTIGAGNFSVLSGAITGGDYVLGNFSSVQPAGTNIGLAVYNTTEWNAFVNGSAPTPKWSVSPTDAGRIIFSPVVTGTYYFVFENPYPASSHLRVAVYITTQYESNVAISGFA